jgi:serine/threonine protein kinase
MEGGKLIYNGNTSCVFNPRIPCSDKDETTSGQVSKIIFHFKREKTKETFEREKRMNKLVSKIKNNKQWTMLFTSFCKTPHYNKLVDKDPDGARECFKNKPNELLEASNKYGKMLSGISGEENLDNMFNPMFKQGGKTVDVEKNFYDLMVKLKPVFFGLTELHKNGIIHNDIKPYNIVLHDGVFKIIDYGLSSTIDDKVYFEKRSTNEFKDQYRYYAYYPLEYFLYYSTKNDIEIEKRYINQNIVNEQSLFIRPYRSDLDFFQFVLKDIGVSNGFKQTFDFILETFEGDVNENKLLLGIDVFSLGFSIASLFTINVDFSLMNKIKKSSPMIRDFFKLFRNMCENYTDRYTSEQAYNTFVKLLDFYSPESKKKNPKSKIQKKKTPKKKKSLKKNTR